MKDLQALFEEAWEKGTKCDDCPHLRLQHEHHPYGSTTATETLYDCGLADREHPDLLECPYVREKVKEMEDDDKQ